MEQVLVSGGFDDLKTGDARFLQEASRSGPVHVALWSDAALAARSGKPPKFPFAERSYFLEALRFVGRVTAVEGHPGPGAWPPAGMPASDRWLLDGRAEATEAREAAARLGIPCSTVPADRIEGFPAPPRVVRPSTGKKVVVTGCYDWFHTGHVRFFEEVSELGDLYVVVGSDRNVGLLKGKGHPMFAEDDRCFMAGAVRYVHQALVSSGEGWMDAEPEFLRIRPDMYAVNADGDRPEKRAFCEQQGIRYVVLARLPREGLTARSSTDLRGTGCH